MRKILSLFAAVLFAFAVNAQGTDFAAPGYSCAADDAVLTGGSSSNFYLKTDVTPHYVVWSDVSLSSNAVATWTVTATRGCYVSVALDLGPVISSNKHNFVVKILDSKGNVKGSVTEGGENTASEQVKLLADSILVPAAGVYTVEVINNRDWGKGSIKNVILTYVADAPAEMIPVSSIVINKQSLGLELNEVELLTATVAPDNAFDPSVTWQSSDPTVATVSETGLVAAVAVGTANIIAKAGEKLDTCVVTVAAATVPSTDFTEPFVLSGKKARLEGAVWKNDAYKLYGDGDHNKNYGNAFWTLKVNKRCIVSATLNGVEGGHEFVLDVFNAKGDSITSVKQPAGKTWSAGEIALDTTIAFAAKGEYTFRLRNTQEWSSGKVAGVTLAFVEEMDPTAAVLGTMTDPAWGMEIPFTLAQDKKSATLTVPNIGKGEYQFKMMINGEWRSNGYDYHRGFPAAGGISGNNDNNMKFIADVDGEYSFVWTFANDSLSIIYPAEPIDPTKPYTLTFTYYNKTDGDGGTKLTTIEGIFAKESQRYIAKVDTGIQVYAGRKYKAGNDSVFSNLKLGSAKNAGELKFILTNPTEVDSIVFNAAKYADNEGGDGFKVNGSNFPLSAGKLIFEECVWKPAGEVDTIDIVQNKAANGRFFLTSIAVFPKVAAPAPQPKFYVTGDSALVTDAGAAGKAWAADAIPSMEDTLTLNLKANQYYVLKVVDGAKWYGYNELTEKTEGLIDDNAEYHNIGFTLAEAGAVKVIYKAGDPILLKVEGNFVVPVSPVPTVAAPVPTWPEYQVKSLYSDTYDFAPASLNSYNEGWWNQPNMTEEAIGGNHMLHYDLYRNGMIGVQFAEINVAKMEKIHMDIYSDRAGSLLFRPITTGGPGEELSKELVLKANQWNSFDIDMATEFAGHNWEKLFQYAFQGFEAGGMVGANIWVDNIYFYTTVAPTVDLENGYYLIGLDGWTVYNLTAADKFAANDSVQGEYMLKTTLAEGKEFKVVAVDADTIAAWYPAEAGNYKVDFFHAGNRTVYFRPAADGGEGWHAGCIYVDKIDNPYETWFATGDTWNTETESYLDYNEETKKATVYVKVDKNGQWRAQVKYHGPIAEEGKCYNVALKLKANNAINNVTIKYQDNAEMVYVADYALAANVEAVFDTIVPGKAGGNGILVLDFGFAKKNDVIEIYDVVIEEVECGEEPPVEEPTYYLVGTITDWAVKAEAAYTFAATETEGEYKLTYTLAENDGIKVVGVLGEKQTWYPDGMGNEYKVDAAHAGEATIYFRPDGQGGEGWYEGYFYVSAGEGFENLFVEGKAVKVLHNGQIYILKNNKVYTVMGQPVE